MKKFLKLVLFLIGFPALLGFVAWKSVTVIQEGITYGFWPFIGVILAGVFFLVYLITFLITGRKAKKNAGNRKKVMSSVVALVIISFVMTSGLWLVIDIPKLLPDILKDATSGTITFDHLREDYAAHAEVHGDLLDQFIIWNYQNKNLDNEYELDYWLDKGYSAPEVQELIATNFRSIDKNGYGTFKGPWINLADGDRLTIPVLVHLILNKREFNEELDYILKYELIPNPLRTDPPENENAEDYSYQYDGPYPIDEEVEYLYKWSILDMQGTPMEIDLGGLVPEEYMSLIALLAGGRNLIPPILETLNETIADDALAGTPIYIGIDMRDNGLKLVISSTVEARGMWDYKKSAWLNSNNLLFAVISIFPTRQWLYIWSGMVVFASVAIGAIRLSEYGGKKKDESDDDEEEDYTQPAYAPADTRGMTPYARTYYQATMERNRR